MARKTIETLIDALEKGEEIENRGITFLDHQLRPRNLSWAAIARDSRLRCGYLQSLGLQKGERIGIVVQNEMDFVLWFFGVVMAGAIPVPACPPLPTGRIASYVERTSRIYRSCGASRLVISRQFSSALEGITAAIPSLLNEIIIDDFQEKDGERFAIPEKVKPSDICFIQYTSGSTGKQKGVMVTHENTLANVRAIIEITKPDQEVDQAVSWLPLYHDMGLIGYVILPAVAHSKVVIMSPLTFVVRPQTWLETVDKYRGAFSASPNFGLAMAAKHCDYEKPLDLSCLRSITCGAEPINPLTVRRFLEVYGPARLARTAIVPAYGMAEATLCITMSAVEEPYNIASINRCVYEQKKQAIRISNTEEINSLQIVSCGKPIPEHSIAILGDSGEYLCEGQVGEILFKGPSATKGYFGADEENERLFHKGWIRSGDLGFMLAGELYVSGRLKDLVIIAGRNYYPQSIESVVETISGIRSGNVAVFTVAGLETEQLVVVAECKSEFQTAEKKSEISKAIFLCFNIRCYDVVLVPPGSLAKTSSGKLQRSKIKHTYESQLRTKTSVESRRRDPRKPHRSS